MIDHQGQQQEYSLSQIDESSHSLLTTTQVKLKPMKIAKTFRHLQSRVTLNEHYQPLKNIEQKYLNVIIPKVQDQVAQRLIKHNVDSALNIAVTSVPKSTRNVQVQYEKSFKESEQEMEVVKRNERKEYREMLDSERSKGRVHNYDQLTVSRHLRYPSNIIHKKNSLPSIVVPELLIKSQEKIFPVLQQKRYSQQNSPAESTRTNLQQWSVLKSNRIKFIHRHKSTKAIKQELAFADVNFDKLEHNHMKFQQYIEKEKFYLDTKKAQDATKNRINAYMQDKRYSTPLFLKPNLYKEWQVKQQNKQRYIQSRIFSSLIENKQL